MAANAANAVAVALVGAGPAGFYTLARLQRSLGPTARFALIEASLAPYGLLRYGVAPDRGEVKHPAAKFAALAAHANVHYFGGLRVTTTRSSSSSSSSGGKSNKAEVSLGRLRALFDAIVVCTGANELAGAERGLCAISNNKGAGARCFAAHSVVRWYNGCPESAGDGRLERALQSSQHVVIVGAGNVALDVARVLATPAHELARRALEQRTDATGAGGGLSAQVEKVLQMSRARHVRVVARRGPEHAAFTTAELRDLIKLMPGRVYVDYGSAPANRLLTDTLAEQISRPQRRLLDLIASLPPAPTNLNQDAAITLCFSSALASFNETTGLAILRDQKTGTESAVKADMAIGATGWGPPSDMLPFIKETQQSNDHRTLARVYAAGWAATGASGTLAATLQSAVATADAVTSDLTAQGRGDSLLSLAAKAAADRNELLDLMMTSNRGAGEVLSWDQWLRVEALERAKGARVHDKADMLRCANVNVNVNVE